MFRRYRALQPGEFILCFVDTSGEGSDWCAAQFLSKTRLDVPIVYHYQGSIVDATPEIKSELDSISKTTGVKPCVAYETNNGGGYELERLSRLNREGLFTIYYQYRLNAEGKLEKTDKMGWNTNNATRPVMMNGAREFVDSRLGRIYDRPTVNEMFSFVKHKTPSGWKAEAEVGAHDDLIMSLAGVWQLYQTENPEVNLNNAFLYQPDPSIPDYARMD